METAGAVLNDLHPADAVVFAAVLLLTLGSVVYGNLRRKRLEEEGEEARLLDLLLMGRRLTLPLFTATLVATWYGGIIPVTEFYYDVGLYGWVTQGAFWYVAYLIFAFTLVKKVRSTEARTMPDLLSRLFGPASGRLGAWMNLFNVLPVAYVMSLGVFLQLLTGWDLLLCMATGTGVVLAYSTVGGFRSVVFSDLIQFVVMCTAVALVVVYSMTTFGGLAWLRASPHIPAGHWNPFGDGLSIGTTVVWALIALGTLVDPNFYHRCLAARDVSTARKGILCSTLVWVCFDFCTTFGALYARAVMPEAESSTAYLTYAIQLLPPGVLGFFLAGVLATILSTLDSYLFLSGTVVAYDLAPKRFKGSVAFHHVGTVGVGILAVVLTGFFMDTELINIWKFFGGFSAACLLAPLMLGYSFPRWMTDARFVCSSLTGAASMFLWMLIQRFAELPKALEEAEPSLFGLGGTVVGFLISLPMFGSKPPGPSDVRNGDPESGRSPE